MSTLSLDLPGHYEEFVNQLVTSGRYSNPSEVVREGLRMLEQHEDDEEKKLATLRKLATEAFDQLDRGEGIPFNSPEQLAELIRQAGRRAADSIRERTADG